MKPLGVARAISKKLKDEGLFTKVTASSPLYASVDVYLDKAQTDYVARIRIDDTKDSRDIRISGNAEIRHGLNVFLGNIGRTEWDPYDV